MTVLTLQNMAAQSGVAFGTSGARGKVVDMTPILCHAYTTAFIQSVTPGANTVVLGHDLRPSSPGIASACMAAIESLGIEVVYGGALPTPALALYAAQIGAPAIVVTGSHIPFDRNGIKFYKEDGEITKDDEQAMLDFLVELPEALKLPTLPQPDARVQQAYLNRYIHFFGSTALKDKTIAVYEHSSVGRDVLSLILKSLGAEVISLGRTDVFVPIDTEAVRHEDIQQAHEWADIYDFDAIVSTDGDADRPLIGDEKGNWLRGDVVGILCAQYLHATAVITPVSSNSALEKTESFVQIIRTRIGSPYVIEGMQTAIRNGATLVVGYEANGGFLLGSQVLRNDMRLSPLPTRDSVLPMLALLCGAKAQGLKISEIGNHLPQRYTASDRIQNFATASSRELIERMRRNEELIRNVLAPNAGPVESIEETDGLRVHFASGDIVHLRPSGNAPELRCYAESTSVSAAKQLCDECLQRIIKSNVPT